MAAALVWIDLEMTGLDPDQDVLLQAALALTDLAAEEEPEVHDFVISQPEAALAGMDDFVRAMHTRSGLIERVRHQRMAEAGVIAEPTKAERDLAREMVNWCIDTYLPARARKKI